MKWLVAILFALVIATPSKSDSCSPVVPYKKKVVVEDYHDYHDNIVFPINPKFYWSVGDEIKEQHIADEVFRRMKELMEGQAQPQKRDRDTFKIFGSGKATVSPLAVFKTNCLQCHKAGATGPGVRLFNSDGSLYFDRDEKKELIRREKIWEAIDSGVMPKGRRQLTENEKNIVRKWAQK